MLHTLKMTNVRRHAETVLDFTGDSQLIALSGVNGAGKSTILEAIVYALYGETRHGRHGIAGMVRRGSEHEGMQVELSFTVGGIDYEVARRYEKGKSTASLKVGGAETMRTVAGVTAEISKILGMDCAGFKLATIAKQKELDGLADLTGAKRKAAVARLLRLDAVQAAARAARDDYNRNKEIAEVLAGQADETRAKEKLSLAQQAFEEASSSLEESRKVIENLDGEIKASSAAQEKWDKAQAKAAEKNAVAAQIRLQKDSLNERIGATIIPEAPEPTRSLAEVEEEIAKVGAAVREAEAAVRDARSRARLVEDLAENLARQKAAEEAAALISSAKEAGEQKKLAKSVAAGERKVEEIEAKLELLDESAAEAAAHASVLEKRIQNLSRLGSACETCEQPIDEEHRARHLVELESELAEVKEKNEQAQKNRQIGRTAKQELLAEIKADRDRLAQIESDLAALSALQTELALLVQNEKTYKDALERMPEVTANPAEHYAKRGSLETEKAEILTATKTLEEIASKTALITALEEAREEASLQEEKVALEIAELAPTEEEEAVILARRELIEQREMEAESLSAIADMVSGAGGELRAAKSSVEAAKALGEEAATHKDKAVKASKAHAVLTAVAQRLSTEIRPALQAEISNLLETLSEGRFTSVQISEDYDITIADDNGKYYPVSEFSGGESDLIALAIRLALAQVVARRHGAGASGFLILDEVLGSQDAGRRNAILEGLRRLRSTYGQILLISHVGGLEDSADTVIEVQSLEGVAQAV